MKKKKKKYFLGLLEKYGKVDPRCPYFGDCGGCMLQHISYSDQLQFKKEYINTLMAGTASIDGVIPSMPLMYRNRMDMVTAFGRIGLRVGGSYKFVVDITSCIIMQEKSNSLLGAIHPMVKKIEGYDYLAHSGYLRYVIFREARFTGEVMVNFITASPENRLHDIIAAIKGDADSISLLHNPGLADTSFGTITETIKGGCIEEDFDGIRFRITPNSFFQSNSEIARDVYRIIRDECEGNVLDLYSGVGSISLYAASRAERVTGVESVQEAVDTAGVNAAANNIPNVEFICADVKEFMEKTVSHFDTMILDPPRGGMNPGVFRQIERISPDKIIYMSCNPALFRDDLNILKNYRLDSFQAFDMFPQTPHIETLAVLKRI